MLPIYYSEYLPPNTLLWVSYGKYYLQYKQYFLEIEPTLDGVTEALDHIDSITGLTNRIVWC